MCLCLARGYDTAFRYGFSMAVAVCLQRILVTEFMNVLSAMLSERILLLPLQHLLPPHAHTAKS